MPFVLNTLHISEQRIHIIQDNLLCQKGARAREQSAVQEGPRGQVPEWWGIREEGQAAGGTDGSSVRQRPAKQEHTWDV